MRSYISPVGVPAERVFATHDGMTLAVGGRGLQVLDTPGHARHHNRYRDAASAGAFAGDTFGVSCRELDVAGRAWVLPITTPVQSTPRR